MFFSRALIIKKNCSADHEVRDNIININNDSPELSKALRIGSYVTTIFLKIM